MTRSSCARIFNFNKLKSVLQTSWKLVDAMVTSSRATVASQPPSSFMLNLPPELRLQIYDAVVDLPLDCKVVRRKRREGFKTAQTTNSTCLRSIPWLSLVLVCKTIANELRHHAHTSGNVAYELEVDNLQNQWSIAHDVTWRRIPCPPSSVRTLQADLVLDLQTSFWGAGGPNPILSELYQLLNCFIHNGPLLVRGSPLANHLHLETLILQIRVIEPDPEERRADGLEPYTRATVMRLKKRLSRDLKNYISLVVDRGLLYGAVDKILCRAADDDDSASGGDSANVAQWDISRQTIGDMTEWNRYDFSWGVPGSSSLELD
ncbi:hypothetical protein B0H12DRAFT_1320962 [Mycena haematopus]|nr:hypothetical protein B0H12DRAFT_1320962 [Mycena haematopus]